MVLEEYVPEEMNFIKDISENIGPRLSGSEAEKRGAEAIAHYFEQITGNVQKETFWLHPMAFIGWIPVAGILGILGAIVFAWVPWITLIITFLVLSFMIIQFIKYLSMFDFLFPRAKSQNIYSIVEPPSGEVKFTLIFSAHMDSSMEWPLNVKNPKSLRYKIFFGIGSAVVLLLLSILRTLELIIGPGFGVGFSLQWTDFLVIPIVFGFLYIVKFLSWNTKRASPGAMDNLSGIAIAQTVTKYFITHPDQSPWNCRILLIGFGSEEAGLRGSRAFAKLHQNDLLKGAVWMMNIDGVGDAYSFNLLQGEIMLAEKYDEEFTAMLRTAYERAGVKYNTFWLDVGASDAISLIRLKKKAITFSAQDNSPRENYHTHLDTVDRIDPQAIEKMNEIVLDVVDQIDEKINGPRENFNQKPLI